MSKQGPKVYKVLLGDKSCHGGEQVWPLPTADGPGEWLEFSGDLVPCKKGYHVTTDPLKWYDRSELSVYEAEVDGEIVPCQDDKSVCRKVRLVRRLGDNELADFNIFVYGTHNVNSGEVVACGSAVVRAWDRAVVRAYGSASVQAHDSALVIAHDSVAVKACGLSVVRVYDRASVIAYGSTSVQAHGPVAVQAHDSATVNSYTVGQEVKLFGRSVQIDRSQHGLTVVRCDPSTAVILGNMLKESRQTNFRAGYHPACHATGDPQYCGSPQRRVCDE